MRITEKKIPVGDGKDHLLYYLFLLTRAFCMLNCDQTKILFILDNDYYSESDDDDETNCDVTSISSGPAGANGAVTMLDEVIGNVGDRKIERFHTTTELVSTNFADTSQNRRNSDSLKQSKISTSKRSDAANDVTFEKNSTSVRIKVPDENTSGLGSESVKLSRSLDSLLVSEHPSNLLAVSYQRAKDRAFKWVS